MLEKRLSNTFHEQLTTFEQAILESNIKIALAN
jgi:hypothetical protein